MITTNISLGQFETKKEAESHIRQTKKRLKRIIDYYKQEKCSVGKLYKNVKPNEFKYYIREDIEDMFGVKQLFPFHVYVETKPYHRWIFQR